MATDINFSFNKVNINPDHASAAKFEPVKLTNAPDPGASPNKSEIESPVPGLAQTGESSVQNNAENLREAVRRVSEYAQNLQRNLQFRVDELTGREVITVIDSESKEVIRQIPSEEMLALAHRLEQMLSDGLNNLFVKIEA